MTREEKAKYIDELTSDLSESNVFYLTDTAELTVEAVNSLRRKCFHANIRMRLVKNALLEKAMDKVEGKDFGALKDVLKGATSIMLSESSSAPAKMIKDFRKKNDKPILKGAFVEESIYIGDDQLKSLVDIKSKNELIGEIIGLLQSPAKNVLSALTSGKSTIAGIVKTLSEKEQ